MTRITSIFTLAAMILALGLATTARASEYEPKRVPQDALWVVHINTAAMIDSKVGGLILEDLEQLGLSEHIQKVKAELGLDPLMDFQAITLYGSGYEPADAAVVVEMGPTLGTLEQKVSQADGYQRTSHDGHAIHTWIDNKHRRAGRRYCGHMAVSQQSMNLLIFSENKEQVVAAIDRISGRGKTVEQSTSATMKRRPGKGSCFFVAGDVTDKLVEKRPGRAMLKIAKSLVYDGGERDGQVYGHCEVKASSTDNATQMYQMAQGLLAMAQLKPAEGATPINRLAKAIRLSLSQDTVIADFTYDAAAFHRELKTLHEMKMKRCGGNDAEQL